MSLSVIEQRLAERIGLDAASIGADEIARAVRHRMRETGETTTGGYAARAEHDQDEWEDLVELVLVPETWFFREPAAFGCLADRAAAHAGSRRFRVLSLPCATGEEPYSIAITLLEAGLPGDRFVVDAVDLSRHALLAAAAGRYGPRALRHVAVERRERFFEPCPEGFRVREEVRRSVGFTRGNLVDPDVLAAASPYDVVFCRNVIIYFTEPARLRVLETLARLVRDDGVLLTGSPESQRLVAPRFVIAGVPRTFAYEKARPQTPVVRVSRAATERSIVAARPGPRRARHEPAAKPHARRHAQPHEPVASRAAAPETEGMALERARRLADAGRLDEARHSLEQALARWPASARAHYLLGVVQLGVGRRTEAEQAFRRAVYLDPAHADALTHLAIECERQGDTHEAGRLRRRAERARRQRAVNPEW